MQHNNTTLEPDWGFDIGKIPQFELRHVAVRDELLYILGVSHSAIKIGDRFTIVNRFSPQENVQDAIGETLLHLKLKVVSITAYHCILNRINADMTAGIELKGDWTNLLQTLQDAGWIRDNDNTHQWQDTLLESEKFILTK